MIKLTKEQMLLLHTQLIETTGGSDGIRDMGLLESALESPFQSYGGEELYPKKVEDFVEALDISAHEPERRPSKPIIPLVTNIGEICKFMGMENRENE